jgi:hypothetical protein
MERNKIILAALAVLVVAVGFVLYFKNESSTGSPTPTSTATSTNTGSNSGSLTAGWKEYSDPKQGITFKYPEKVATQYVGTVDWPPKAQVLSGLLACTQAGTTTARAGKTALRTVNGHTYCVTEVVEAAAGTMYTQYAYAFPKNGKTVILTFTIRKPQCANYPEPQKSDCLLDQSVFDPDGLIDRIAQTVVLTTPQTTSGTKATSTTNTSTPRACTMEAKLCPDGSYVGRTGPNCEFTPCPTRSSSY